MDNAKTAIDVSGLRKTFADKVAVDNVSLQVDVGEIFGFLGPNGSGKTTTIRMICGLLTPDAGIGHCLGYDISKQSYAIKLHVGYMPQRFSLYEDLSIYQNLDFIARIYQLKDRQQRVEQSLVELGLHDRRRQLAGTLSGGWKQRLALAAALLHEPKLLLLDEPTAGVDPKARRDFWDHIHSLSSRGITTLVSTHYMDEAERCHRLAYIMKGQILIRGTIEEILKQSNLIIYEVKGNNLIDLKNQLREFSHELRFAAFGNTLHVTSNNLDLLEQSKEKFAQSYWQWQKVAPNLEDVFVNLADNYQEDINA